MGKLRILYLGDAGPHATSEHRCRALERIGCDVEHLPTSAFVRTSNRVANKIHYLTGHRARQNYCLAYLRDHVKNQQWDVIWVDAGWWCGPRVARFLRQACQRLVLVNLDDPTGPREPFHWQSLRRAVSTFHLCVTVRRETESELRQLHAEKVLRIWRGYDEVAHAPALANSVSPGTLQSEVAFIGTRMEDRHEFLIELVKRNVPLSIWGNGWKDGPGWGAIKQAWRGPGIVGPEYVAAIQRADICLGLLSKGNRDQHTQRSAEIPFAGGLFCAQRTSEHLQMYQEGKEAVFWDNVDECAETCHRLLNDDRLRGEIRAAGAKAVRALGIGNETNCQKILEAATSTETAPASTRLLSR